MLLSSHSRKLLMQAVLCIGVITLLLTRFLKVPLKSRQISAVSINDKLIIKMKLGMVLLTRKLYLNGTSILNECCGELFERINLKLLAVLSWRNK
jgi:hypothetical protein